MKQFLNLKDFFALLLLLSMSTQLNAQVESLNLRGSIVSQKDGSPLPGATVMMINIKDTSRSKYLSANADGTFLFEGLEKAFYRLKISSIGYKSFEKIIRLQLADNDIGAISIAEDVVALKEVQIEEQIAPVQQKGDTTQYNAAAFKANPDATSADLVKKMPGITVDQSGVKANGETVQQVLLDGKRFFGQDPLLSLNTVPAEMVDKVLVYDEQSEQSKLTGFDDGNTIKTMDLITKSGKKNGQFGELYAGAGTDELYKAGGSANSFNGDQRITVLAMSNNINQQNFGQEDLVGLAGSGGRGGFRRGGSNSFITGEQSGITQTNSVGINFTDQLSKKLSIEGSYFLNSTDNAQDENLSRETFLNERSQFYQENSRSRTENENHRLNLRLDYDMDDNNKLLLRSSLSVQNQTSADFTNGLTFLEGGTLLSAVDNLYKSTNESYNINNRLIYQHKFKKIGRTLSLSVNQSTTPSKQDINFQDFQNDSLINYLTDAKNQQYQTSVTYTEPVGTSAQLSAKYEYKTAQRASDISVFGEDEEGKTEFASGLSNKFNSDYSYHQPKISYSYNRIGTNIGIDLGFQQAVLKNEVILPLEVNTKNTFSSLLPSIRGRLELSQKTRLYARYSTSTTEPSISQLQNVINNTNPLFINLGNENLNQTYSQSLRLGARYVNSEKNISLSNFSSVQNSYNYITDNTSVLRKDSTINGILIQRGAQLTAPVNLNGYWSAQNNTTFGIAVPQIKNNINASLNVRYVRTPGMLNEQVNYANTYSAALRLGLSSNISKKIDYNLYYEIDGSQVKNSLQVNSNSSYNTQTFAIEATLTLWKGIVWRNDTYFQRYSASNAAFNSTYTLWNMGIAKKFLKNNRGELELSVFDLLGQNQSFSQTINSRYLEEVQTKVLQQYFMLTFTYRFSHFK